MIVRGKWNDSLIDRTFGFQGIMTNVDPAFLPDGFVPESTNLHFENGLASTINKDSTIGTLGAPIEMMFMWNRDNGENILFAQAGNILYKLEGGTWSSVHSFSNSEACSISGGFFDSVYIIHPDGFFKYNNTTVTQISSAPKAKYLLLWQTYLFAGGSLVESDGTVAPFRVRWSPFADASLNDWYSGDAVQNFVDFRTTENSNINGLGVWNRRIIVFTKDSIEELAGSKPSQFIVNTIYKGKLTAINNRAIAYYDYVYYLSEDGLCIMAKDAVTIGDIYKKYWNNNASSYSLAENKGVLYGNSGDDILVYNTLSKMYEHYFIQGANTIYSANEKIYIGKTDGTIVILGEGSGSKEWTITTKEIDYKNPALWKRTMGIDIVYDDGDIGSSVDVTAIYDGNSVFVGSFTVDSNGYVHLPLSHGLFKKMQIKLSGNSAFKLKLIEVTSKVKRKGGV